MSLNTLSPSTGESAEEETKAMSWQLTGRSMELCSCKMLCPCWLGPEGTPDEGWCGGALGFDIQRGNSDGIDLGGTKIALTAEWPGNFFGGQGTARLYIGDNASAEQRRELEAIFSGKKGGLFEGLLRGRLNLKGAARRLGEVESIIDQRFHGQN